MEATGPTEEPREVEAAIEVRQSEAKGYGARVEVETKARRTRNQFAAKGSAFEGRRSEPIRKPLAALALAAVFG